MTTPAIRPAAPWCTGPGDSATLILGGGATPLNLYYSHAVNWGDNDTGFPHVWTTRVERNLDATPLCQMPQFDAIEGNKDLLSGEASLEETPERHVPAVHLEPVAGEFHARLTRCRRRAGDWDPPLGGPRGGVSSPRAILHREKEPGAGHPCVAEPPVACSIRPRPSGWAGDTRWACDRDRQRRLVQTGVPREDIDDVSRHWRAAGGCGSSGSARGQRSASPNACTSQSPGTGHWAGTMRALASAVFERRCCTLPSGNVGQGRAASADPLAQGRCRPAAAIGRRGTRATRWPTGAPCSKPCLRYALEHA